MNVGDNMNLVMTKLGLTDDTTDNKKNEEKATKNSDLQPATDNQVNPQIQQTKKESR